MNEMVYRNSKRYFVLAIYVVVVIVGLIANVIAMQKQELGAETKVAVFVVFAFIIGGLTLYVMTQRVFVGPVMVSQESAFGKRRVPYQRVDGIDFETLYTRRGPIELMKVRYQGDKLVLTSSMEGFQEFSREIVRRCPDAPIRDARRHV